MATSRGPVFAGLLFCSTGIAPEERESLDGMIRDGGGEITDALLDTTTHLIVGRVGTTKHVAAARHPTIACVASDFVRDSTVAGEVVSRTLTRNLRPRNFRLFVFRKTQSQRNS